MSIGGTEDLHSIGERCYFQNFKGIIRYVGEVPPTEGIWYGVEWDTQRGKHDGMLHGKRYFQCKEQYGSFVRPHKISFGVDAITGLKRVYGDQSYTTADNAKIINKETKEEKVVELVGFDKVFLKQSNFESLKIADLYGANISHSLYGGLEDVAPNLISLALRDNLLSSLTSIYQIAGGLKKLESLDVSQNQITDWSMGNLDINSSFQQMKNLSISKMNLKWNEILILLKLFPTVIEVNAYMNQIDNITYDETLENIEVLHLGCNQINEWSSILQLAKLGRLQKLMLNENRIGQIVLPSDEVGIIFKSLTLLSLDGNSINEWNSVNSLNKLKSLTDVHIIKNPITQGFSSFESRQELIARLEHVQVLNRSQIDERERKTAELAYIKKYSSSYYKAKTDGLLEDFNNLHPRYMQIANVQGLHEENLDTTKSLKENLLSIEIRCPDCSSKPVIKKKVPSTMTIQQLRGILQRVYKIANSKQQISYLDKEISREIKLEDNMKQLEFYSISSGDTVLLRW